jgi:hypothetical protein
MIEEVNAERTGEASDTTTCFAVKIWDYLKSHIPLSKDSFNYWLSVKFPVISDSLLMLSTFLSSRLFRPIVNALSADGDFIRDKRSRLSADHFHILLFLNKYA